MIPRTCKRLIEVDFPIAEVSKHSAREKSIRHGHPSTLHLWWARRPLAACRAVLLLPDPCDADCPPEFKPAARAALANVPCGLGPDDEGLRAALLKFIGDFANWDMSSNPVYLKAGRDLVKAAHGDEPPLVVDPFAGGGSIPLEALRLGCDAFASDLNPVACLILKVLLEDIPRHGPELADELRKAGAEIKKKAEEELREFYPPDPDGSRPIAYLWARTVQCESPNCGAEIPILKSLWLSKKGATKARYFRENPNGRCAALLIEDKPLGGPVTFRIARGEGSEGPRPGFAELMGTKARGNNANVVCPCCNTVLPGNKSNGRTSAQLAAQQGGADVVFDALGSRTGGARLVAVVTLRPGQQGRNYRLAEKRDYEPVQNAMARLAEVASRPLANGLTPVPDEPLPPIGTLGFRVQRYGMLQWGDLFSARQKMGLAVLSRFVASSSAPEAERSRNLLALAVGKTSDLGNAGAPWKPDAECPVHLFSSQKVPPLWDWAEAVVTADSSGSFASAFERTATSLSQAFGYHYEPGQVSQGTATDVPLPASAASIWFTDPPYYDAIPYSDLSDFFLAWIKRSLPDGPILCDPFDRQNPQSPKIQEIVQDETRMVDGRPKDKAFFEEQMALAFAEGRRVLTDDGVSCVVFAHKTTQGWEALLTGMVKGGWVITGSWPIATESGSRLRARDSAALATSVHLICRPRSDNAPIGDWGEILRELPNRIGDWMERLSHEGVRGADLVFACIGPALELYSKHPRVETPEGRTVDLAEFLEKVWEVVGRSALEQILGTAEAQARNGNAGALEEDSRLTALFLWTLQATNGGNGEAASENGDDPGDDDEDSAGSGKKKTGFGLLYDVVRRFAQPLGIHLEDWEDRIIETEKGVVRLLPIAERAKALFGEEGASGMAAHIEAAVEGPQGSFDFDEVRAAAPVLTASRVPGRRRGTQIRRGTTTLDRVHAAMLLQRGGRAAALRALIDSELDRGPDFLRLANALSALYPKASEEKRLVDAMLLGVRR